jgi:hypothetical protein
MNKKSANESPLERLVKAAQEKDKREKAAKDKLQKAADQNLPVKLEPKKRLKPKVLIPIVEDDALTLVDPTEMPQPPADAGIFVANSSLTFNINFNVDDKAVDRAIETSKQVAKGIAAAGAAMLGTAFLLNNNKTVDKVKIPLTPNPKVPNIKKPKT